MYKPVRCSRGYTQYQTDDLPHLPGGKEGGGREKHISGLPFIEHPTNSFMREKGLEEEDRYFFFSELQTLKIPRDLP